MRYFSLEEVGVEEASKLMKSYMERYGVTEEALLTLSVTVFLFSSLTIILASKTVVTQHKGEINILRSIGASRRLLKIDIIIKLLPSVLAASIIGMLAASAILTVIQGFGYLQVLSYTVPFNLEPAVIALNLILPAALVSISVLREKL
jgi:predicted lysophospholipase L1 biosynthesis ABC-type transport system permease subunit